MDHRDITRELIAFTVDRNPHKQGLLLPGTDLPICAPETLLAEKPDYVFILPWNLKDEIMTGAPAVNLQAASRDTARSAPPSK